MIVAEIASERRGGRSGQPRAPRRTHAVCSGHRVRRRMGERVGSGSGGGGGGGGRGGR